MNSCRLERWPEHRIAPHPQEKATFPLPPSSNFPARRVIHDGRITVEAGKTMVQATGTYFGVHRLLDSLTISVYEGSIEALDGPGRAALTVTAGQQLTIHGDGTIRRGDLSTESYERIAEATALLSTVGTWLPPCPLYDDPRITDHQNTHSLPPTDRENRAYQGPRTHAEIHRTIQDLGCDQSIPLIRTYLKEKEAKNDSAHFQLAFCLEKGGHLQDALTIYEEIAQNGLKGLREHALHRANRLLVRHLGDLSRAEAPVRRYLHQYPNGRWREYQMNYLIQILDQQGATAEREQLIRQFVSEFPRACPSRRFRLELSRAKK